MLAKKMAYLSDRAVSIVGRAVHQYCNTARGISFIAYLFVRNTFQLTGTSLNRPVNRVARHIGRQRFIDRGSQSGIRCTVATPYAGGYRNFTYQLGKQLAAFRVLRGLAKLDIGPLAMPCHLLRLSVPELT